MVVQIVDARNPLRFRCEDLESYVRDVEGMEGEAGTGRGKRVNLLLINKSDLLTTKQRQIELLLKPGIELMLHLQVFMGRSFRFSRHSLCILFCR
jgi:hypothetical protein